MTSFPSKPRPKSALPVHLWNRQDRNSSGRITSFHRDGGSKPFQQPNDLKRNAAPSSMSVVEQNEYDFNCSSDGSKESATVLCRKKSLLSRCTYRSTSITPPKAITISVVSRWFSIEERVLVGILAEGKSSFYFCIRIRMASHRVTEDCSGCIENTFFALRARGEVELQVRNWKRNNNISMHKNKRKAAIS
ncbi:hypothetical protein Ahy_B09g097482 [Arachis hypogaea]|uniref:Uncharacterized protein n=1 Tax=Arachis hypogaea TaxID=3818 RepID=A0A444XPF6_ARAHY|nr:hypothetical protein Ahy_B09g097482 [Arachis hypogaea]